MSNWRSFGTVPIPELITFMMTCHANTEGVGIKHAWLQMCSMHPMNFILNSNLKYAIIQGHLQSCQPFHHRWRSTRTGPSWPSPQSSSPLESTTAWSGWTTRWNRRNSRYLTGHVEYTEIENSNSTSLFQALLHSQGSGQEAWPCKRLRHMLKVQSHVFDWSFKKRNVFWLILQ